MSDQNAPLTPLDSSRPALVTTLEQQFRRLSELLYDTSVGPERLEQEVMPFIAEEVTFVDPWQTGHGREVYRQGLKGFHAMFRFHFEFHQVSVQLEPGNLQGRAMIDGIMHLKQLSWLYTYPLRTQLVYHFRLEPSSEGGAEPRLQITAHEEMWSFADLFQNIPGIGALYTRLFRPAFGRGFLLASRLASRCKWGQ